MKVAAFADNHGVLPEVPSCDLLLIAGDICPVSMSHDYTTQRRWLIDNFIPWAERQPAEEVVLVAGNHDFVFEAEKNVLMKQNILRHVAGIHYLEDSGTYLHGYKVWGTPWTPWFHDWAFNAGQGPADGPDREEGLGETFSLIPEDTDIIVTHGPPYSKLDRNPYGEQCGSRELLKRIKVVKPKLVVFGHIHYDAGKKMPLGDTMLANVGLVDERYEHVHEVFTWELP